MRLSLLIVAALLLTMPGEAGPTLTDFWNGHARWVKDAENIGTNLGLHFISVLSDDHGAQAYYIGHYIAPDGKSKLTVAGAHSADGINWTDDGMVLDVGRPGSWDDRLASFPGVWKDGDTWYLVYEGAAESGSFPGDIGLATSKDGHNFVKYGNNPLLRHNPNGWERANIGTPSLYKENGVWYLFYHGYDGNVCQIGVASGPSPANLAKAASNPIVPVTPGGTAWDTGTIGRRSRIVKEGAYYYFAFEGSTQQPYDRAKWSSGLARSTNLTAGWTKFPSNPIIPQTQASMGNDGPELVRLANTWYLYVRTITAGKNVSSRYRLEAKP